MDPVQDEEDLCAAACATYGVLLAAHDRGLAGYWRTPGVLRTPAGPRRSGIPPDERFVALIHLGWPRQEKEPPGACSAGRRRYLPGLMSSLIVRERPAAGAPEGLLVLHHGRGTDEHDLLGLADVLDPQRRLHVVTPRAPLTLLDWPGYHWYRVPRVGYPDPETFQAAYRALAELHDELWERTGTGPEQTVLGGFSMGTVMSYALGLGADRPAPAGILALSGFVPTVEGWSPSWRAVRERGC